MEADLEFTKKMLIANHEIRLESMAKRRVKIQEMPMIDILPNWFFCHAFAESKDLYVQGQFYGCITMVQALAEGLARFLAEKNMLPEAFYLDGGDATQIARAKKLFTAGKITKSAKDNFDAIAIDRNLFHHMSRLVIVDPNALEQRAEECYRDLLQITNEIFAYSINGGKIAPTQPNYWRISANGDLDCYIVNSVWT